MVPPGLSRYQDPHHQSCSQVPCICQHLLGGNQVLQELEIHMNDPIRCGNDPIIYGDDPATSDDNLIKYTSMT